MNLAGDTLPTEDAFRLLQSKLPNYLIGHGEQVGAGHFVLGRPTNPQISRTFDNVASVHFNLNRFQVNFLPAATIDDIRIISGSLSSNLSD